MKKFFLFLICIFFLTGCSKQYAVTPVKEYLNKFRNHDVEVTSSLEELLRQEDLLKEQALLYELIMKKQYVDLEYEIKEETYNGDHAVIQVLVTVYDFSHSKNEALLEKNDKIDLYILEDGSFDKDSYINLQLKYMKNEKKRISYTVSFFVNFIHDEWVLETPDHVVLQKIHGLYDSKEED